MKTRRKKIGQKAKKEMIHHVRAREVAQIVQECKEYSNCTKQIIQGKKDNCAVKEFPF